VSLLAGSLVGAAVGGGLLLAVTGSPIARQPTLEDRLGPYLRDTPRPSRLLTRVEALTPFPTLERILRPGPRGRHALRRAVGGRHRERPQAAGAARRPDDGRAVPREQVIWGGFGLAAPGAHRLPGARQRTQPAVRPRRGRRLHRRRSAGAGPLAHHQVSVREERMLQEFPTIAELLASP
jgi:tight adherence protein C